MAQSEFGGDLESASIFFAPVFEASAFNARKPLRASQVLVLNSLLQVWKP